MKGEVVNGAAIIGAIKERSLLITSESYFGLQMVFIKYQKWYEHLFYQSGNQKETAWDPKQLEHRFQLQLNESGNPNNLGLYAPDYQSGHLDWFSFDHLIDQKGDIPAALEILTTPLRIPVNISFKGMPDKRLFAFEDSKINLEAMKVDASDLIKMIIQRFALVSGNDWFVIPLDLELGSISWIDSVLVKDGFGVCTEIINDQHTGPFLAEDPLQVWDVFKIRDKTPTSYNWQDHFLYLAPTTTFRMESEPIEEILFLRDEYANMVWGIERIVRNKLGNPVNGFDLHLELNGPFFPEESETPEEELENPMIKYKMATTVPTHWIPYLPRHFKTEEGQTKEIELRRAMMVRNEQKGIPEDIVPLSYLAREELLAIREEAIPKAGRRVQLTFQRTRWTDGETYLWLGRKVLNGRGEGSSGLRFDHISI